MIKYLQQQLLNANSMVLDVAVEHGWFRRCGLVAVDAVGIVIDREGIICVPWTSIRKIEVELQ